MKSTIPLACNMGVFTPPQRDVHLQVIDQLFQKVESVQQNENGYEFTLPNQTDLIIRIGEFIANERLCCPFLEFALKVTPNNKPISLLLTGPEGIHEFMRAEFSEAFTS